MRTFIFIIFLCFFTVIGFAQSYSLTVVNGKGSGTYQKGETVHIWSNTPANNAVFTAWSGNQINFLERKNEWHTTLTIPQNSSSNTVTITANFQILSSSIIKNSKTFMLEAQNGTTLTTVAKECFYAIPPSPKGIVFLFHGTGGQGVNFFERFEPYNIIKDLVKNKYAVFTLDANETTIGDQNNDGKLRWNNVNTQLSNNVDLRNISALKTAVQNEFALDETLPVFSLGMSAGAVFSDICATILKFNGSAHITAKGRNDIYTRQDIAPVIWIMSDNDNNISADNTVAFANYTEMLQRQTAQWILLQKTPLHSQRFLRNLNGITQQQSEAIFNKLLSNNYLDANYMLTLEDAREIPTTFYNNLGLSAVQKVEVLEQLLYANADHILHSEYNKAIISFFDERIESLSISQFNQKDDKIVSFPNPVTTAVRFQIKNNFSNIHIKVFSMDGKLLLATKNTTSINVSHFSGGLYAVKLFIDNEIYNTKFIKY